MVMIVFRKWVTTGCCEKLPFDNTAAADKDDDDGDVGDDDDDI